MADTRTNEKRLNRINKMLKESFGYKNILTMDSSFKRAKNLHEKAEKLKQKIVDTSEYNTYHKNKDYNKALLVMEACDIVMNNEKYDSDIDVIKSVGQSLKENDSSQSKKKGNSSMSKTVSPKEKIAHLESLYENYVNKNGFDEKSNELNEKLTNLKKEVYKKDVGHKLKMKLSEDTERAETIMAAQGLLDDILNYQAKIGEMLNETLDSFVQKVNAEYSSETGDQIREKLNTALNNILDTIDESKSEFYEVVNMVSGDEEGSEDSMMDEPDIGSLEDDESNEEESEQEDLDLDNSQDEDSVEDESEKDSDSDSEDEEGFDLDLDSEDFERRQE